MMKTVALTIATLLSVYCVPTSQVPENEMFPLLITTVKRVNDGSTAEGRESFNDRDDGLQNLRGRFAVGVTSGASGSE
jgi:hypothetical protein